MGVIWLHRSFVLGYLRPHLTLSLRFLLPPQQSISLWKWHFKRLIALWPSLRASDRWLAQSGVKPLCACCVSRHGSWGQHTRRRCFPICHNHTMSRSLETGDEWPATFSRLSMVWNQSHTCFLLEERQFEAHITVERNDYTDLKKKSHTQREKGKKKSLEICHRLTFEGSNERHLC